MPEPPAGYGEKSGGGGGVDSADHDDGSGAGTDAGGGGSDGGGSDGGGSGDGDPTFLGWARDSSLASADHIITGNAGQQLSCPYSIAVADFDGDGMDDLAISSIEDDVSGVASGSVFLFRATTVLAATAVSSNAADGVLLGEDAGDLAGQSLAVLRDFDGDGTPDLGVGAVFADSGAGRAYLLSGADLLAASSMALADATHRFESDDATAEFGGHIADAGDLDGDGLSDFIVGSIRRDTNSGAAWVFLSSDYRSRTQTFATQSRWLLSGEGRGDYAGARVASLPDVDGDSLPELIATAYLNETGGNNAGRAYVLRSSQLGDERFIEMGDANFIVSGPAEGRLGLGVATTGDIDGDGIFDLLLGAPDSSSAGTTGGHAFMFSGATVRTGGTITSSEAPWSVTGEMPADYLGFSIVAVPDLDGDGADEILTGAKRATSDQSGQGAAYLFLSGDRGSSGTTDAASATFWGEDAGDQAGRALASGDINGDGFADLVVGSCHNGAGGENAGTVYVVLTPVGSEGEE